MGLLRRRETKGGQALNHAGLRFLDVLIAVQEMYEQAPEESGGQLLFTAQAEALLEGWVGEAPGVGRRPLPREPARQRADALGRANSIRMERAGLKRDQRRISPGKTFGGLSPRQRVDLVRLLA